MTSRWKLNKESLKKAKSDLPRLVYRLKLKNRDGSRPFIHNLADKK